MKEDLLNAPIVFIGPGRSGSTIVSEFIFEHEDLAWLTHHQEHMPGAMWVNSVRYLFDNQYWRFLGEKSQLNKTRRFNGLFPRPAEAYPFWEKVTRDEIDFSRGFLLNATATEDERKTIRNKVHTIVKRQGKKRFSMKITGPARISYIKSIFPDAIFINVIRDPVYTVKSLLNVPFWADNGLKRLWWTGAYSEQELKLHEQNKSDQIWGTAFQVHKIMQTTQCEASECGVRMLTIKYEDFVSDPRKTIEGILQYANLPSSKWIEKKLQQSSVHDRNSRKKTASEDIQNAVRKVFGADYSYEQV
jgi:hypothetical protein